MTRPLLMRQRERILTWLLQIGTCSSMSSRCTHLQPRPRLVPVPYSTGVHFVPAAPHPHMGAVAPRPLRPWSPQALLDVRRPVLAAYIGAFRKGVDPSSMYWAVKMTVCSSH